MKSRTVDTVVNAEEEVRLRIYDGDIPLDAAGAELLRFARAERDAALRALAAMRQQPSPTETPSAAAWTRDDLARGLAALDGKHATSDDDAGYRQRADDLLAHLSLSSRQAAETAEDRAEQIIQAAIDRAPEPLRRLGEWLANKLDEDEWKTAERLLLGAATVRPAEERAESIIQGAPSFVWRDIATAPKDGKLVTLLVRPYSERAEGAWTPFEDSLDPYQTIGFNSLDHTGEDRWQFAGWCWSHDHITEGDGEILGWAPFTSPAEEPGEGEPAWGEWVPHNQAPQGSYACLYRDGTKPVSLAWMPTQGRPNMPDAIIMPFKMPEPAALTGDAQEAGE